MAVVSMRHPELAVDELARIVEEPWLVGIVLSAHIDEHNLDHPRFRPIFERAQHHDLPVCFHAGSGRPPYAMGTSESSGNLFLMHAFAHPLEQMRAMAALVGGGVFDQYPRLRAGFIEAGIGWVAWWLDRIDEHARNLPGHVPLMRRRPIEYLQAGQCFLTCTPQEAMLEANVAAIGDRSVLFGSDYPHWDCGFPGAVQRMRERRLDQSSITRIFWDNAVALHSRLA
jgi:predicted TIM-barrel fold metal-dependent hydrolase